MYSATKEQGIIFGKIEPRESRELVNRPDTCENCVHRHRKICPVTKAPMGTKKCFGK